MTAGIVLAVVVAFVSGAVGAGVAAWRAATARARVEAASALRTADERARFEREAAVRDADARAEAARAAADARIEELRRSGEEQRHLLDEARERMADTFKALAARALEDNVEALRRDAAADLESRHKAIEGLVKPVRESLDKVGEHVRVIEKERAQHYGAISQQMKGLATAQDRLQTETGNLVKALRAPQVRGRWGEIQLKRVVELAGMVDHCDFTEQATMDTEDGRRRPDMVVHLPGGQSVVVDSKVPLGAYLEALEAPDDDARKVQLRAHAAQVQAHVRKLSEKAYWDSLPSTPEFVVLFLPGESFYSAALAEVPALIEEAVAQRVILATPTTLIALLQAVHFGWRQERIAENAQAISDQGRVLHERLATMIEHFNRVGDSLARSLRSYNDAMASLDARVMPAARRFEELGARSKKALPPLSQPEGRPRIVPRVDRPPARERRDRLAAAALAGDDAAAEAADAQADAAETDDEDVQPPLPNLDA